MFRFLTVAGAGALLLTASGCTLNSFLMPAIGTSGPRTVVTGSAEMVAAKLQDGLAAAGISVMRERDRNEIRIAGETKDGKQFCLHLHDKRIAGVDKTLVHVLWGQWSGDPEFWRMVVDLLAEPSEAAHN